MTESPQKSEGSVDRKRKRWRRRLKWAAILMVVSFTIFLILIRNHIRTLNSLRRVPNTNVYVMDYYCDYGLEKIRREGMNPHEIEDSFIGAFFPNAIASIARRVKRLYISKNINRSEPDSDHCSTVSLRSKDGRIYFGRNFDWPHDACLVVRIHDRAGLSSVAVIDLHYLNLDRDELEKTNLLQRIPLLFAPYYVMDGMNRHGVAISEMSVDQAAAPYDNKKPSIISATLMRVVLDHAKTTNDAIKLIGDYNVCFPETTIHFMITDASGCSRIVEFINGEICVSSPQGKWQVCTNSVAWKKSESERDSNCVRYQSGSERAAGLNGAIDFSEAMETACAMSVEGGTMWTSIYELTSGEFRILYKADPELQYQDVSR